MYISTSYYRVLVQELRVFRPQNAPNSVPCNLAAMPHKPSVKFSILSSAAGSAQIEVSSQSGDCSVTDEFQSTHLRLTRLVNSELTAACMHAAVTAGCDDLQNGRGSQYWWR